MLYLTWWNLKSKIPWELDKLWSLDFFLCMHVILVSGSLHSTACFYVTLCESLHFSALHSPAQWNTANLDLSLPYRVNTLLVCTVLCDPLMKAIIRTPIIRHTRTEKHAVWIVRHAFFSLSEKTSLSACFVFRFWSLTLTLTMVGRGRGLASMFLVEINQTETSRAAGGDPGSFLYSTPSPRVRSVSCHEGKICLHFGNKSVILNLFSCCSFSQYYWYFLHFLMSVFFSRRKEGHHCGFLTNLRWRSNAKW